MSMAPLQYLPLVETPKCNRKDCDSETRKMDLVFSSIIAVLISDLSLSSMIF